MTTSFMTPITLFAAAVACASSPDDQAIARQPPTTKIDGAEPPQDWYDNIMAAEIREAMRHGLKLVRISHFRHLNAAQLEMQAQRLRDAGFDAGRAPDLPLWARLLAVDPIPHILVRLYLTELAAKLSAANETCTK